MLRSRVVLLCVVCVLAVGVLSGCASQAGNAKALEAHTWKVDKLGGAAYTGTAPITAKFSAGTITGSTGVNTYNAKYAAPKANDIAITPGVMTRRAGTPEAMKAESDYIKALGGAASYAVDDNSLTLFDSTGNATVEYAIDVSKAQ